MQVRRAPQANSTTSMPRAISPSGVGEHLAVLGGEDLGELALARVEQLAEREHHRLALGDRGLAARRRRPSRPRRPPRRRRRRSQPHVLLDDAACRVEHVARAVGAARRRARRRPSGRGSSVRWSAQCGGVGHAPCRGLSSVRASVVSEAGSRYLVVDRRAPGATSSSVTTHGGTTWMRLSADERQQAAREQLALEPPDDGRRAPARGSSRSATSSSAQNTPGRRAPRRRCVLLGELGERRGRCTSRPMRAAFSTMPSSAIASIEATIDAIASGCPL